MIEVVNATGGRCVLITIPISHYCEKARWALDRAGIAHRESAHLQIIHRLVARRAGGGATVPVLVCGDRVLTDSAEIVIEADTRARFERRLYPDDRAAAAEARTLERDFDARLGPHGRLWMYNGIRGRRDLALAYGCTRRPRLGAACPGDRLSSTCPRHRPPARDHARRCGRG
jgi:glutathione S-transferase